MMTLISVIIPLFNHERYIYNSIKSVLSQTIQNFEIIIVDDGSLDNSSKIAQNFSYQDIRIKYFYQTNQGAHQAINNGITKSEGRYITILNSDDIYHKKRFEKTLEFVNKNPDTDAVFTDINFINETGEKITCPWYLEAKQYFLRSKNYINSLVNGNFFMSTSNLFIKSSVIKEIGYFSDLRYTHDLDFFLRLFVYDKKVKFLNAPLLYYRIHPDNTIKENHLICKIELASVIASFLIKFAQYHKFNKNTLTQQVELYKILKKTRLDALIELFLQFYISLPDKTNFYKDLFADDDLIKLAKEINDI